MVYEASGIFKRNRPGGGQIDQRTAVAMDP